jgi:hypothetical protein
MSLAIFIRWATREIKALWQRLEKIDVQQRMPATRHQKIVIDQGNTLDTDELGIKYEATAIDEVPSAYDPDATTSFIDGIGRGTLWVNGIAQTGYVLVVNDARSSFGHALLGDNSYEDGPDEAWAFYQVAIPVAGGGAVVAWVVG